MCVLRVADGRAVRQERDSCEGNGAHAKQLRQLAGWKPYHEPERAPARPDSAARERALDLPGIGAARFLQGISSLALGPTCQTWHVDTRSSYRIADLALRDGDRDNARRLMEQAGACGSRFLRLRGWQEGPGYGWDLRMIAQTHCGTRYCEDCSERIRRRQIARVQGPWEMFITLTMPQAGIPKRWAWDHFYNARRIFLRELRRESNRRYQSTEGRTPNASAKLIAESLDAQERIIGPEKIEYAWAIEPHASGYPHLHLVLNLEWIDFGWSRKLWSKCLGVEDARIDGRKVWSVDGVCNYLAKYISKRRMSLDILAVIKGRRTWACTLINSLDEDAEWWPEDGQSEGNEQEAIDDREAWGADEGWESVAGKDGCYAIWRRPAEGCGGFRVVSDSDLGDRSVSVRDNQLDAMPVAIAVYRAILASAKRVARKRQAARIMPWPKIAA